MNERMAPPSVVGGRSEATGQPEVAEQDDQTDRQRAEEERHLRSDLGPEDTVEPDRLEPQGVRPEVEDGGRQQEEADDDHDDDHQGDLAAAPPALLTVARTARWPLARGPVATIGWDHDEIRSLDRFVLGFGVLVRVGPLVGAGLGVGHGVVRRTAPWGVSVRVFPAGDRLAAAQLLQEFVEQVAHRSESSRSRPNGPSDSPGGRSGPVQALDRSAESGEDRLSQLVGPHRRGTGRFEAERCADHERCSPRTIRIIGWDDRSQPQLEAPGILEDQAGQGPGDRRTQSGKRRIRRRPALGCHVAERDHAIWIGDPQDRQPPAVWPVGRATHPREIATLADAHLVLADERRPG